MKKILLKIYYWSLLSKEKTNQNQKHIRDVEWKAIAPFIKNGLFLDVGCGAGYSMERAKSEAGCVAYGIDPEPGAHGVGRSGSNYTVEAGEIKKAFAENIPFDTSMFDTVYSSHVLEHVNSEKQSLKEMERVLKDDGILIIGMPTASMAFINMVSSWLFTTHFKMVNLLLSPFIKTGKTRWWELFFPVSHSSESKTVFSDLRQYRSSRWKKAISEVFEVTHELHPMLYPYPEYIQWFKARQNSKISSSVFFICRKKTT
jgi:ubiquinone/menaquinone biosynthesis C-methylase UbiE